MQNTSKLLLPDWPEYSHGELEAVSAVLRSGKGNYWFGEQGKSLEREFADYIGMSFGLTVGNGTLALELALRALGIGPGDEVIVTPRSFVASANCILLCGATPVFVDVDSNSQNITADTIAAAITPKTRAVIAVHLAGWPCDMNDIMALADARGMYVIEDCAQAHGAAVNGKKAGSIGHVSAFSFCHDKIMSAGGEGGIVLTNDEDIWARAAAFRNHGKDPRSYEKGVFGSRHSGKPDRVGSNYRLTEMQSAICRVQLQHLDTWVEQRRSNAKVLDDVLGSNELVRLACPPGHIYHSYYKYYFFIEPSRLSKSWSRDRIILEISNAGIPCSAGTSAELYKIDTFVSMGCCPAMPLPVAKSLGERSIMLPVSSNLTLEHMTKISNAVDHVLQCAKGN